MSRLPEPHRHTRVCTKCRRRKYLNEFSPHPKPADRIEHQCKRCRSTARRLSPPAVSRVFCVGCGKRGVGHKGRCAKCEIAYQNELEANAKPLAPGPEVCGLMDDLGGWCIERVRFGTDRLGLTTMDCRIHGIRLMPRHVEPPENMKAINHPPIIDESPRVA